MSIQSLNKDKHGYDGFRVLVQIGKVHHRRYFSTAGMSKTQAKAVKREAEQLNARLLERKHQYQQARARSTDCRATVGREFGLTGIQLSYSARRGIASPYFRIYLGHTSRRPKLRSVSIVSRGLDLAWEKAIDIWAATKDLSESDVARVLHENKPTLDHFEYLAECIFKSGYTINVDRWIDAGIA